MREDGGVKVLDFCVSVQFDASAGQLTKIREVFSRGSEILADATDGQMRFGDITIFENGAERERMGSSVRVSLRANGPETRAGLACPEESAEFGGWG